MKIWHGDSDSDSDSLFIYCCYLFVVLNSQFSILNSFSIIYTILRIHTQTVVAHKLLLLLILLHTIHNVKYESIIIIIIIIVITTITIIVLIHIIHKVGPTSTLSPLSPRGPPSHMHRSYESITKALPSSVYNTLVHRPGIPSSLAS